MPVTHTAWAAIARLAFVGQPDESGTQLNPWCFHAANVAVHLASSLLVLRLLRRLIDPGPDDPGVAALAGALLFALHPVQVETVAWVSGLKDLLCWAFSLAALLVYVRRVQVPGDRRQWAGGAMPAAALLMALGVLSKPTAIVLPAAMWVIDGLLIRRQWRRALIDLLPLLAISAVGAVLARAAQDVAHVPGAPLWQRPLIVGDAFAFYAFKLAWPATLTIDYARTPAAAMASPWAYAAWLVPLAILLGAVAARRRAPAVLAAAAIFAVGVAPVSGVATFQMQLYSTVTDHYLYFAMLGPALAATWALARWRGRAVRTLACVVLAALAARSFVQAGVWRDDATLFAHAVDVRPGSFLAHTNMASNFLRRVPSRPDVAEPHVDAAYAIAPDNFFVLGTYATVKAALGKKLLAFAAWDRSARVLRADPRGRGVPAPYATDVARQLLAIGEPERALAWARDAVAADPNQPRAQGVLSAARRAMAATRPAPATTTAEITTTAPAPAPASSRP